MLHPRHRALKSGVVVLNVCTLWHHITRIVFLLLCTYVPFRLECMHVVIHTNCDLLMFEGWGEVHLERASTRSIFWD